MTHTRTIAVPLVAALLAALVSSHAQAQPAGTNYDESKVGSYTLPDPLVGSGGAKVVDAKTWMEKRRPEILELYRSHVYGRSPAAPADVVFERGPEDPNALGGKATRQEIKVSLDGTKNGPRMTLLLYVPNGAQAPAPVFLSMNFDGNHTVSTDPGITIAPQWRWDEKTATERLVTPDASTRGQSAGRWPVETIIARGYALAVIARADVEADYPTGWKHGVRAATSPAGASTQWKPDDWGAIGAWAWGLSRALDYLETGRAGEREARRARWGTRAWARPRSGPAHRTTGSRS